MTKINFKNNTKTSTTIVTALAIALILLSPMTVLPNVNAQIRPNTSVNQPSGCEATLLKLPDLSSSQKQSAIALAEKSALFLKNVQGSDYVVVGAAPNYNFDTKTCSNFVINGIGVYFKLGNGSNLGIFEDGSISKVIEAKIPHTKHSLQNIWSGYEVYYQHTQGTNSSELFSAATYIHPSVSSNAACNTAQPYECNLSDWNGLDNHGRYLSQTGTDAVIDCQSGTCSSQQNTAWWEFIDGQSNYNNGAACQSSDVVTSGDSMTAEAENGLFVGGTSSEFRTILADNSASPGWVCQSPFVTPSGWSVPDTALTMLETPATTGTDSNLHITGLPTFSSVTYTGNEECYGSSSCVYYYSSTSNGWDHVYNMLNCPVDGNNVNEGSMSTSSSFTSTYNTYKGTGGTAC